MSTARTPSWEVNLTAAAESDFQDIILWTLEQFGEAQARTYSETLSLAIEALVEGPETVNANPRDDIARGIHSLHVPRNGRKGRHFVMFRAIAGEALRIEVLRILHDAMDFPRYLPS